jgi:hypothetical protein
LLVFLNSLPAFFTCLATPFSPEPVPGIFTPSTFFGLLPRRVPRTTPPTSPAAAVATPVTTAAFDEAFEPAFELRARPPDERADELRLPEPELPLRDEAELRLRDAELPLRDDAAEERRLEALALFGLLREPEDLLFEDPLRLLLVDALWLFGLDPFELRAVVFRLFEERELAWAIAPP